MMMSTSVRWHFSAAVALTWAAALVALDQISRHSATGDGVVVYFGLWLPPLLSCSIAAALPLWRQESKAHYLLFVGLGVVVANVFAAMVLTMILHEPVQGNERGIWVITSMGSFLCALASPVTLFYLTFSRILRHRV